MNSNVKKILIAVGVLVVAFILFMALKGDKQGDDLLVTKNNVNGGDAIDSAEEILGAQIIEALNQINSLELERDIFDSPVYQSLEDKSKPIEKEPIGRPNPFAPLGVDNYSGSDRGSVQASDTSDEPLPDDSPVEIVDDSNAL